jgi:D-inositol-3-phosphate glycosyltransferase
MSQALTRLAMVSLHTSPGEAPGTGDAGGMNVVMLETAKALAERGVEVDLLTRAVGPARDREIADGVRLVELVAGPQGPVPKNRLVDVADAFGEAVAEATGRLAPRYDLVHAHYWLSGLATLPVAIELGLPFVQSFHTLAAMKAAVPGGRPESEGRLRAEAFLANQADALVAAGGAEVEVLLDTLRAPTEKTWVVAPGVDVDAFTPGRVTRGRALRERLGLPAEAPVLAVVGRLQPLKAQDFAIRVLAEVRHRSSVLPVLVIAGETTPGDEGFHADLVALAASLGVADAVHVASALDRVDTADLLALADLTLVPSRSESFGLVALESAASGTPVLAERVGGLTDSVADGVSGVLLDGRDPTEWADAARLLLEDRPRLDALSGAARRHAEGRTWAASASGLLTVYEALTAARRSREV